MGATAGTTALGAAGLVGAFLLSTAAAFVTTAPIDRCPRAGPSSSFVGGVLSCGVRRAATAGPSSPSSLSENTLRCSTAATGFDIKT